MKTLRKYAFAFLLLITLMVASPAAAKAAEVYMDNTAADSSITIHWVQPSLSSYYTIDSYQIYDYTTATYIATGISSSSTQAKITGLTKGYNSRWRVEAAYHTTYGSTGTWSVGYSYVNTTPAKIAKKSFGIGTVLSSTKKVDFAVSKAAGMTGTQVAVFKGSKRVKLMKFTGTYSEYWQYSPNVGYRYRVRAYYTNSTNTKTYYGAWSDYRYFAGATAEGSYRSGVRGCKLTLKRGTNIKKYMIYVSTDRDSGYKKTMTVSFSTKSKTFSVTKIGSSYMKKGVFYYVRVIPYITHGSSSTKSDVYTTLYFTNPA